MTYWITFNKNINMNRSVKFLMTGIFLLCIFSLQAQERPGPGSMELEVAKKRFIENRLDLTDEESDAFWPVYDEHQRKLKQMREDYKMEGNPMFLSDEEAETYLNNMIQFEEKALDEKKRFIASLREVLPIRKVLFLQHLEREFRQEVLERIKQRMQNREARPRRN
jgi:hypothetical protein